MIRLISTLAIAVALAGPAAAQQIKVSLIGKDDQTIRWEIHKAAVKACRNAYLGDRVAEFHYLSECISGAESGALAQARAYQASAGSAASIASLSPAATPASGR
jgi:hypothetical protein